VMFADPFDRHVADSKKKPDANTKRIRGVAQ
jgi:hypothetical protein